VAFFADGSATPLSGCGTVALKEVGANYSATCSTSALAGGNHTISATYSGDADYLTSTGTLTGGENVLIATALTTSSSSVLSGLLGLSTTFTAKLTTLPGGAPLAGQTVSFSIGGTAECSAVTNASGVATCTASVLGVVSQLLTEKTTATYKGTTLYQGSTATAPVTLL
jgi:hypothetical protein